MVEEMLAERGICVTYETVRQWGKKFGKAFSDQIHKRAPARGDELCRKIGDGVNQAADLISATASIPSLNFIPLTTFGNWF